MNESQLNRLFYLSLFIGVYINDYVWISEYINDCLNYTYKAYRLGPVFLKLSFRISALGLNAHT